MLNGFSWTCCGDCEVETAAAEGAQLLNLWMADITTLPMFSAGHAGR